MQAGLDVRTLFNLSGEWPLIHEWMVGGIPKINLELKSHPVFAHIKPNTWIDLADVELSFHDLIPRTP